MQFGGEKCIENQQSCSNSVDGELGNAMVINSVPFGGVFGAKIASENATTLKSAGVVRNVWKGGNRFLCLLLGLRWLRLSRAAACC